jgi:hypothetical protein
MEFFLANNDKEIKMEDIAQKIDELIETINNNTLPLWISIVGIFVPILLSGIIIVITIIQNKKNKELQELINNKNYTLQKDLSDRDVKVQMHGDILKIYDDFCYAQNVVGVAQDRVHVIFSNFNTYNGINTPLQWNNGIMNAVTVICQAKNRAELLLPTNDIELKKLLKNLMNKYRCLKVTVDNYCFSGIAFNITTEAWNTISTAYNIKYNDYDSLTSNPQAYTAFLKLCSNDTTQQIETIINEILDLFQYEKFDKYFEKYLRMDIDINNKL